MSLYVLSGDPGAIRTSADSWARFSGQAVDAAEDIRRIESGEFLGDEADTYRERMDSELPPHLDTTGQAWNIVARALTTYADALQGLQSRLSTLGSQADDQQAAVAGAQTAADHARDADAGHELQVRAASAHLAPGESLPVDTYQPQSASAGGRLSDAQQALQQTIDAAKQVRSEHAEAVRACVGSINEARGMRFEEPPGFWGRLTGSVVGWIKDHAGVLLKISSILKQISAIAGMLSFIPGMAAVSLVAGAGALVIDGSVMAATGQGSMTDLLIDGASLLPGAGAALRQVGGWARDGKALLGAGEELGSVARAGSVGEFVGESRSAVEGLGLVDGAGRVSGDAATLSGDAGRVGRASDFADNAVSTRTPVENRVCVSDPIDVVTGEMVLTHTDVSLPGVLPLVLRRTHLSSYRWGGVFGPSWASTLDQRVEIDASGDRCFVAEDGSILYYPRTEGPALPSQGIRRWPLRTLQDGRIEIEDPEAVIRRQFFPPDHLGTCRIAKIVDGSGNHIDFHYDTAGIVTEISHSGGYRIIVGVESGRAHSLELATAAPARLVSFGFDGAGNLDAVINSSGLALRYSYDDSRRITGWVDRNEIWYGYTYDEQHRCVRTDGRGRALSYAFSYGPSRTTVTDSVGSVTVYHFNRAGQVVRQVDPLGAVTTSWWDRFDRLLARTDPLGRTTQYVYDELGRLVRVTYPDGSELAVERDHFGWPAKVVDPDGAVRRFGYSATGLLLFVGDASGHRQLLRYHPCGALAETTDPLGHSTHFEVDSAGLLVGLTDAAGSVTRFVRDPFGRVTKKIDALGAVTRFEWTAEGRPATEVLPDGTTTSLNWDAEGNLIGYVDAVGARTAIEIGILDLPVARVEPEGARYSFFYDTELRLVGVENPAGLRWAYVYDAAGRLIGETDFNGRTCSYEHDAAGQLTALTSASGDHTSFGYDLAGNVVSRSGREGVTTFTYDRMGRTLSATGGGVHVEFERDLLGRVVAETVDGRRVCSEFDTLGSRIGLTTPSGLSSRWSFDAVGRPAALDAADEHLDFDYDPVGREVRRRIDSGVELGQGYDAGGRLARQQVGAAGSILTSREFRYRADGMLTSVADRVRGTTRRLEVDAVGRITTVNDGWWSESYSYDPSGSISTGSRFSLGSTLGPGVGGWTPDRLDSSPRAERPDRSRADGALRKYDGTLLKQAAGVHYRHDRGGRLVSRTRTRLSRPPETWQYGYDSQDRMVEARSSEGVRWTYTYDPFGRRVSKQRVDDAGAVLEQFLFSWDGSTLVEQLVTGAQASEVTTWAYLPNSYTPIAQCVRVESNSEETAEPDPEFYAIVTDLVGTPTELVTTDGRQVVWSTPDATVWGAPRSAAGSGSGGPACPLRFPGQYADDETGLNYNRHRYYDPEVGRYTTADPLGLEPAPDPYGYVKNPTRWIDPLGLKCENSAAIDSTNPNYVYRSGSSRPDNLTPRPNKDHAGLSAYDSPARFEGKVQVIDLTKLKTLRIVRDGNRGHILIRPENHSDIAVWAATRETGIIHPLTQELLDAISHTVRMEKR